MSPIPSNEAGFAQFSSGDGASQEATSYPQYGRTSWLWQELNTVRHSCPPIRWGLWGGTAYSALETYVLRGKAPWTLRHHEDHKALGKAAEFKKSTTPAPKARTASTTCPRCFSPIPTTRKTKSVTHSTRSPPRRSK